MMSLAIFLGLLGASLGSFALLVAERMTRGEGFAMGRSRCDHCGQPLCARDLVPVVSWLVLRARARCCAAVLSWRLPGAELAFVSVPLVSLAAGLQGNMLVVSSILGWTLTALLLIDLATMRLPDALTLPLAGAGIGLAMVGVTGAWPDHLLAAAFGLGAVVAVNAAYRQLRGIDGIGMGDAKLLCAAGAWLGTAGLLSTLVLGCFMGLAMGSLMLRANSRNASTPRADGLPSGAFPLGPALAMGFWSTWLLGPIFPVMT